VNTVLVTQGFSPDIKPEGLSYCNHKKTRKERNKIMDKWQEVEQKLAGLINEIRGAQGLGAWKYKENPEDGAEQKGFDDSAWPNYGGKWWDTPTTVACFCIKRQIPVEMFGIDLKGSQVNGNFYSPNGAEVFVNGKSAAKTDWLIDVIFPVVEKITKAEELTIVIRTLKAPGWGSLYYGTRLFFEKVEDRIFRMEVALNVMRLAAALSEWKGKKYAEMLNKAVSLVDIKALDAKNAEQLVPSLEKAQEALSGISGEAKKLKIHLVGHAHIDMNWLWTWPATLNTARGTFKTVDSIMDEVPDFKFSQSQAGLYDGVEENLPELYDKIKKRVKQGKWDVTASTWVEGDLNTAGGEALVRQTLYAKKYVMEKFGLEPKVCWCPDTFGHPWTYPQILKKSGIDFYYGHRCRPQKEGPLFWWESPDGTRILALVSGESYNMAIRPDMASWMINHKKRIGINHYQVVYGIGDHGGGPTRRDVKRAKKLQQVKQFPAVIFDSAESYYKGALKDKKNYPVCRRELNFTFEGCYSNHGDIKLYNRTSENLLPAAESLSLMSNTLGGEYPAEKMDKAWHNTLFSQFHDIYCGCAIHPSYGDGDHHAKEFFTEVASIGKSAMDSAMQVIASKIDYKGKGKPVVVFNPHSWERTDIAMVKVENRRDANICDDKGNCVPTQLSGDCLIFAATVPAMGFRTYYVCQKSKCAQDPEADDIKFSEDPNFITAENRFYTLRIRKNSGGVHNLIDKSNGMDCVPSFKYGAEAPTFFEPGNLLQVHYEKPHGMSAWIVGPIGRIDNLLSDAKVELKEKGPVRVVISVERKILDSDFRQDIVLYRDIPRVDFYADVDWKEKGTPQTDGPMLKVAFPVSVNSSEACFEIPFGYIYRPTIGNEVPSQKWMDLTGKDEAGKRGLSILNNCKYGCDAIGNVLRLTLIRSGYEPDPVSAVGEHHFGYAMYPHKGDWRSAGTVNRAAEFNQPLLVTAVDKLTSLQVYKSDDARRTTHDARQVLPETHSFVSVEPKNLIVSAFKKAEDGKGMILRFYEAHGKATKGVITLNVSQMKNAVETDMIERPLAGKKLKISGVTQDFSPAKIKISVGKHEIKTIRLS